MQNLLRKIIPGFIRNIITSLFYGWKGNYDNWDVAKHKCSGYDSPSILKKVKDAALQVKNGSALYERDSVLFNTPDYSYSLITSLLWASISTKGKLNVLDFGGSLGSTYFHNAKFLDTTSELNWCIVEQPNYVKEGLLHFANKRLHFFNNISECYKLFNINVVFLSSVLQYLEYPYALLDEIIALKPTFIIIDRTPFIKKADRITIQKVHPKIYKASYPCWFFNKRKFMDYMSQQYELILEFDALDKANIKSEFKGFLYKLRPSA